MIKSSSSLSAQLTQLKIAQPAVKLAPNQTPASLLYSKSSVRNVDIDMVYSLAMAGYGKLSNSLLGELDIYL